MLILIKMKNNIKFLLLLLGIVINSCASFSQADSTAKYLRDYNSFVSKKSIEKSKFNQKTKDDLYFIVGEKANKDNDLHKLKVDFKNSDYLLFESDSLIITLNKVNFKKEDHNLSSENERLLYVDDDIKLGCLFDYPKTVLNKFEFEIKKRKAVDILNGGKFKNIFNPIFTEESIGVYANKKLKNTYIFIEGGNDGKGYYSIVWVINDLSLKGNIVYIP